MAEEYTPRDDLADGDLVKLTGDDWGIAGVKGEERRVYGTGFAALVRVGEESYYIFDPTLYRGGKSDWSVTRVEVES